VRCRISRRAAAPTTRSTTRRPRVRWWRRLSAATSNCSATRRSPSAGVASASEPDLRALAALTLATLGVVTLPTRLVESAIAASVVLSALNNIFPLFEGKRWMVAFAFGLIHGFGFASVLADLGLPQDALLLALVGFNLGVEGGQLAIVSAFLPLAYILRGTLFYRRAVLFAGSILIMLLASVWLVERLFSLKLLEF